MLFMAADRLTRVSPLDLRHGLSSDVASLSLVSAELSLSNSAIYPALEILQAAAK